MRSNFLTRIFFVSAILFSIQSVAQTTSKELSVTALKCEYKREPLGVDALTPVLSWEIQSKKRGVKQSAYRILVSDNKESLNTNKGNIWDSGKQLSENSIQVIYAGKTLKTTATYYWKVMSWDQLGIPGNWSQTSQWQMGLLKAADWNNARWIAYDSIPSSEIRIPAVHGSGDKKWGPGKNILPLIRKEFSVDKPVKKATMFICGLGHFEMNVNGKKVGDHFLDPGWTDYDKEAQYVSFDITGELKKGKNAIGVLLGNGFYYVPRERYRKITGAFGYPKLLCRLVIEHSDGTITNIISDPSWKTIAGPISFSSIYGGEDYDAALDQQGWDQTGFDDNRWKNAMIVNGPPELKSQTQEPIKIFDRFSPVKISSPGRNAWVYDLGQNASGIPEIEVKGKTGASLKLIPAELLDDSGYVTQKATGSPSYSIYKLKGSASEPWRPFFTYYGFRYVQVEGAVPEGEPNPLGLPVITKLSGLHTRNAAEKTGEFSCSNELFNRIYRLINWAVQSNMASVLTDCPHREKLGWLEQLHLMGNSIHYNYDIASFCRKIIRDMITAQTNDGLVPDIAPEYVEFDHGFRDSPEWGSSGILAPWYMYEWYGDKRILEESYDMMKKYADYLQKKSENGILSHGLGDWFDIGPKNPGESQLTPKGITATTIYYYDLIILSKTAKILGRSSEAEKYQQIAKQVRDTFNKKFFDTQTKEYGTGSQAANSMAVYMGLVDTADSKAVIDNIVKDVREHNNGLTAGDIGYRYLLRVLEDAKRSDVIFDMNNRSDVPGYGYQLAHGATALTESWQAYRFVSNNHLMLGHIMEWFYSGLAGIKQDPNSIAYKNITIDPNPVGDITQAAASFHSPYGLIKSEWKKENNQFSLDATVPVNTIATIYIPAKSLSEITEGGTSVSKIKEIKLIGVKDGKILVRVGSGNYKFNVKM